MSRDKRIKEIAYELDKLHKRQYEIQNNLDYDEYYSNDTYDYEGQREEDEEWVLKIQEEIDSLEKELFELTGTKFYWDFL